MDNVQKRDEESSRQLSERQRSQLATIRDLWRGKTVVMEGGAWTAEAREPQRKERLMEQLQLSQVFRRRLEDAAKKAEKPETSVDQVRRLLLDHTSIMNRLVSLTDAVRGRYILDDSYQEYNIWAHEQQRQREDKLNRAKSTLRDHMERMANPNKPYSNGRDVYNMVPRDSKRSSSLPEERTQAKASNDMGNYSKNSDHIIPNTTAKQPPKLNNPVDEEVKESNLSPPKQVVLDDRKPAAKDTTRASSDPVPLETRKRKHIDEDTKQEARKEMKLSTLPEKASEEQVAKEKGGDHHDPSVEHTEGTQPTTSQISAGDNQDEQEQKVTTVAEPSEDVPVPDVAFSMPSPPSRSDRAHKRRSTSSDHGHASKHSSSSPTTTSKKSQRRHEVDIIPDVVASITPTIVPKKSSSRRSRKKRQIVGPKKCHNCKQLHQDYLKCHYFQATGSKCGKFYCVPCLKESYEQDYTNSNRPEGWHCPACLGSCKCPACARQREREARRTLATQERQRSKRKIRQAQQYSAT